MDSRPLELDGRQTQQLLAQVAGRISAFLDGLETAPAAATGGQGPFDTAPGEDPRPVDELLNLAFSAAGVAVETAGPRFFGYIPGGGVVSSAVGELISRSVNRYTGLADLAPWLVALEDGLLRWLASLFDLPTGAGGPTRTRACSCHTEPVCCWSGNPRRCSPRTATTIRAATCMISQPAGCPTTRIWAPSSPATTVGCGCGYRCTCTVSALSGRRSTRSSISPSTPMKSSRASRPWTSGLPRICPPSCSACGTLLMHAEHVAEALEIIRVALRAVTS